MKTKIYLALFFFMLLITVSSQKRNEHGKAAKLETSHVYLPLTMMNFVDYQLALITTMDYSNFAIQIVHADGSGLRKLADGGSVCWSPDGSKLAFSGKLDGDSEIYTINADGTGLMQLTDNTTYDGRPDWSPDGQKIVYSAGSDGVYVMNAIDGSAQTQLTSLSVSALQWSPTGEKLALDASDEIYIISADGSGLMNLTQNSAKDIFGDWSPDGSSILFVSNRQSEYRSQIYQVNVDGTGLVQLTHSSYSSLDPEWSPDGSKIALFYDNSPTNPTGVYVMNPDGSGLTFVAQGMDVEWSADGKKIAYSKVNDIGVVNVDGTGDQIITDAASYKTLSAKWMP